MLSFILFCLISWRFVGLINILLNLVTLLTLLILTTSTPRSSHCSASTSHIWIWFESLSLPKSPSSPSTYPLDIANPITLIEKMNNNRSLNANRFRQRDRPPTYGRLIGRIFRLRDQIERRNQLADSGQSNTELFNDISAGIDFETLTIELSIWDVHDDADKCLLIDVFQTMIGPFQRQISR